MIFSDIFKVINGIGDQPEINRTLGFFGGLALVSSAIFFEGWNMAMGRPFDVVAFCLALSGAISTLVAAVGVSASIKDRGVAAARATNAATAQAVQDTAASVPSGTQATKAAKQVAGAAVDEADAIEEKAR